MKKPIFILFFIMTGIFLMPKLSVACTMSADMDAACCQPNVAEQEAGTPVSSNKNLSQKEEASDERHNDDCNHSSCQCPAINIVVALPAVHNTISPFEYAKKRNPFFNEMALASGFHSIWQPPKIS